MKKRFTFNKLVRDQVPQFLASKGIKTSVRQLTPQELQEALKVKLVEEAKEALVTSSSTELMEELADVLEILRALSKTAGIEWRAIEEKRVEKAQQKGGFKQGIYCSKVELESTNPHLSYYLNRPQEYPEEE